MGDGVKQNKLTAVTVAAPEKEEEEEEGGGRRLGSSSLYQAQNTDSFNKALYMIEEEEEETYNIYNVHCIYTSWLHLFLNALRTDLDANY